jgi:hypothetical protein
MRIGGSDIGAQSRLMAFLDKPLRLSDESKLIRQRG